MENILVLLKLLYSSVFPMLTKGSQEKWVQIEQEYAIGYVTKQGRDKRMRKLLEREGLIIVDKKKVIAEKEKGIQ